MQSIEEACGKGISGASGVNAVCIWISVDPITLVSSLDKAALCACFQDDMLYAAGQECIGNLIPVGKAGKKEKLLRN